MNIIDRNKIITPKRTYLVIGLLLSTLTNILFAQKQFEVVYGGNMVEQSRKVIQAENNDYIILGMTKSYGSGDNDLSITRIDTNGDIIWTKIIGTPDRDGAYDIKINPTGGYMIAFGIQYKIRASNRTSWTACDTKFSVIGDKILCKSHLFDSLQRLKKYPMVAADMDAAIM